MGETERMRLIEEVLASNSVKLSRAECRALARSIEFSLDAAELTLVAELSANLETAETKRVAAVAALRTLLEATAYSEVDEQAWERGRTVVQETEE